VALGSPHRSHRPTPTCIEAHAHALARYAALAQEAGLVPIVEPEVLMDGAHPIERCAEVTGATLRAVYDQLARHRVVLEASLLKPDMVVPGQDCPDRAEPGWIAATTPTATRPRPPSPIGPR
jgi:fructose-bisphosphate aldolase class I